MKFKKNQAYSVVKLLVSGYVRNFESFTRLHTVGELEAVAVATVIVA